jgi:hypothetical protein
VASEGCCGRSPEVGICLSFKHRAERVRSLAWVTETPIKMSERCVFEADVQVSL